MATQEHGQEELPHVRGKEQPLPDNAGGSTLPSPLGGEKGLR